MASRDGPAWARNEEMTDMHRKLELGRVRSLVEKPWRPGSLICLLYAFKQRRGVMTRAEQEAGLMVCRWIKGTGVDNPGRSTFCRGGLFGNKYLWEGSYGGHFLHRPSILAL